MIKNKNPEALNRKGGTGEKKGLSGVYSLFSSSLQCISFLQFINHHNSRNYNLNHSR